MIEDIKQCVSQRVDKLRQIMLKLNLEAAVLQKPENVFYFSHFNPIINSQPSFLVVTHDNICLLTHSLRALHARAESAVDVIHLYGKWGDTKPIALTELEALQSILNRRRMRLGLEHDSISLKFYRELSEKLAPLDTVDLSLELNFMKMIKDDLAINRIRKAAFLTDVGVEASIAALSEGLSESEASTEGQYAMRRSWHKYFPNSEVCGFGTADGGSIDSLYVWCLSNERISYGCDCPKPYYPQNGDLSLTMAWAKVDGYHAECERSLIVEQVSQIQERAYFSMLEARKQVFELLKPGVSFKALYLKAINVFTENGFERDLPGRIGHGVGYAAHEFLSIADSNHMLLAPGMVLTIEPGLLNREWGGVRHSDTVLITENGYEAITRLPGDTVIISPTHMS